MMMVDLLLLKKGDLKKSVSMVKIIITGLTALLFLTEAVFASREKTAEVYGIDDVVVSAEDDRTYVEDRVTEEELSRPGLSDSVLESLQNLSGVQLRRTSLAGDENGKLRIRGFGETRLRILKDGVPIQRDGSYGNGPVDWSTL